MEAGGVWVERVRQDRVHPDDDPRPAVSFSLFCGLTYSLVLLFLSAYAAPLFIFFTFLPLMVFYCWDIFLHPHSSFCLGTSLLAPHTRLSDSCRSFRTHTLHPPLGPLVEVVVDRFLHTQLCVFWLVHVHIPTSAARHCVDAVDLRPIVLPESLVYVCSVASLLCGLITSREIAVAV